MTKSCTKIDRHKQQGNGTCTYTCMGLYSPVGFGTSLSKSQFAPAGVIKGLVCVEAGHFSTQELGCVDVPATALSDNPQWFNSPGALRNMAHLLTLQQSAAVNEIHACVFFTLFHSI